MKSNTTRPDSSQLEAETAPQLFDNWFDPIETEVRARSREFIEELLRRTRHGAVTAALRTQPDGRQ
jgi:putative transposase